MINILKMCKNYVNKILVFGLCVNKMQYLYQQVETVILLQGLRTISKDTWYIF